MTSSTTAPTRPHAPFTLRSAAGLSAMPAPLGSSALVIVDAQLEYGPHGRLPLEDLEPALEQVSALLDRARRNGSPIIHVLHRGADGSFFDPADGGRVLPELSPANDEIVVHKGLPNAFAGTDLRDQLTRIGDPPLVIAGFMTHMCVSSTARAALDLGLSTTVVSDGTATRSLPAVGGTSNAAGVDDAIPARTVHAAALAALADRFSAVVTAAELTS